MKRIFKIFAYFILTIILLIIVLLVVAKLAENKITDIALKKVSESIEAPVNIDEVSLNLLRKFPLATIELNNVILNEHILTGDSTSSSSLDTIANIKKLFVSVKSKPLINGIIEIMKVDIDGAKINYRVDTSGTTNIDFLISSSDTIEVVDTLPSKPLNLTLTDLTVKNIVCNFVDSSLKTAAHVLIPDLKVNAKLDGENIIASVKGGISLSECSFDNTNLYLMNNTDINFDIDYENDSITVKDLLIQTDGANLGLSGHVVLGDQIKSDIQFSGTELILGELIKYAPKEILKEFGVNKLSGIMNLDATVKGAYSKTEMPQVNLNISFRNGNIITKDYPELKNISFNGKLTNGILRNNQSTQADFSSFHFETAKSKFDLAFSVLDIDKPKYNVKTDFNINISEFTNYIPDSLFEYIDGNINANLTTKGELPDSIGDDFIDYIMANSTAKIKLSDFNVDLDTTLSVKNFRGEFTYVPYNFKVKNLYVNIPAYLLELQGISMNTDFEGSVNDLSNMSIDLKSFHMELEESEFDFQAKVKNLEAPSYELSGKINLDMFDVNKLIPDTLVNELSGNIKLGLNSSGELNLDSISDQIMDIVFNSTKVNLELKNFYAQLPDDPLYKVERLNGKFELNSKEISINKMNGTLAGIEFGIDSTNIWNTYEVIFKEDSTKLLTAQTNISLGAITNDFIGNFLSSDSINNISSENELIENDTAQKEEITIDTVSTEPKYLLPDLTELGVPHFLVRGKLDIEKVEYEKNIVDDISLKFRFTDSLYVIDLFRLKTCDGELNTSLKLDARRWDKPVIDVKNYITNLDVKQLLMVNDNFGDTSLTHEKVNGILTSELHVRVFYDNGSFPTERIRAEGHFTLKDGRIYGYEPLVDLSKNKILGGLKGLDKLDFNTLNTSLFMFKDKIYIPKTDIVTSSMDITAFAMHDLKGDYEYHLKVHLGDVLTGKNKKIIEEQAKQNKKDGSNIERGGLKLVSMKTGKDKKNGFDNDKLERTFKQKLNKQQGWLRLLFNPLLVNFSTEFDRTAKHKEIIEKYGTGNTEE